MLIERVTELKQYVPSIAARLLWKGSQRFTTVTRPLVTEKSLSPADVAVVEEQSPIKHSKECSGTGTTIRFYKDPNAETPEYTTCGGCGDCSRLGLA